MPVRAKRPCRRCGVLVGSKSGLCPAHSVDIQTQRKQADKQRGSAYSRGYNSAWQKFRVLYLRDHPLCRECYKANRLTPATEIHHIVELVNGGSKYDESNLMELCHSCHARITAAESGGFGNKQGKGKPRADCGVDGVPVDSQHHWNRGA
jgi:5-methylcytosine-specific restriction protein A